MKKINLFISALMICLAILVAGGATVPAMQFQAQAVALRTASNGNGKLSGLELFDSEGRYAVSQADLTSDKTFQFFGHDWRVVYINENKKVATFWMADPYTSSAFYTNTASAEGINKDGSNIWLNGYSKTVWDNAENDNQGQLLLAQSNVRSLLATEANRILEEYSYAKDKIKPGYVEGTNENNAAAKHTIPHLTYAEKNVEQVQKLKDATNELTAYYDLDDTDYLWLPSINEIKDEDKWNLLENDNKKNILGWTDTTNNGTRFGGRAWLRTPDCQEGGESCYVMTVTTSKEFKFHSVGDDNVGVRPAIHLDITNIADEYQAHLDATGNGNKGSWFDEDWLKALFIVVCIIGLVGVALVIIAVILKARKNKAESQQA